MYLTLVDAATNREVVKVTAISGNVLTIERAQDNTSARAWYAGTLINQRVPNVNLDRMIQKDVPRSVTAFPHGTLIPNYPGEKILQTGAESYQNRWWKASGTIGGADETNWRLIAGTIDPTTEEYDEDGYVVKQPGFYSDGVPSAGAKLCALGTYDSYLHIGTRQDPVTGHVYKRNSKGDYTDLGGLDVQSIILSIVEHDGDLYASTYNASAPHNAYKWDGGTSWTSIGQGVDHEQPPEVWELKPYLTKLINFDGNLYGANWGHWSVDKYLSGTTWETVDAQFNDGDLADASKYHAPSSIIEFGGTLFVGTQNGTGGALYELVGGSWVKRGTPWSGATNRVYTMVIHDSDLFLAVDERLYKYESGVGFTNYGSPVASRHINTLNSINNNLYAGVRILSAFDFYLVNGVDDFTLLDDSMSYSGSTSASHETIFSSSMWFALGDADLWQYIV
jgi:hypothetical protein